MQNFYGVRPRMSIFYRSAIICGGILMSVACATVNSDPSGQWAAHGYLLPGSASSELIGVYDDKTACLAATDYWMSRQVVGNAISSECLPVDQD